MQLSRSSTLSGHIKLVFLVLAVFVVLVQTFRGKPPEPCLYGLGLCRTSCKKNENKKTYCKNGQICCTVKMSQEIQSLKNQEKPKPHADNLEEAHFLAKKRHPSHQLS